MKIHAAAILFLLSVAGHNTALYGESVSAEDKMYNIAVEELHKLNEANLKDLAPSNFKVYQEKSASFFDKKPLKYFQHDKEKQFFILKEVEKKFIDNNKPLHAAFINIVSQSYDPTEKKIVFIGDRTEEIRKTIIDDLSGQFSAIYRKNITDGVMATPEIAIKLCAIKIPVSQEDQLSASADDSLPRAQQPQITTFALQVDEASKQYFGGNTDMMLNELQENLYCNNQDDSYVYIYLIREYYHNIKQQELINSKDTQLAEKDTQLAEIKKKSSEWDVMQLGTGAAGGLAVGAAGLYGLLKYLDKIK